MYKLSLQVKQTTTSILSLRVADFHLGVSVERIERLASTIANHTTIPQAQEAPRVSRTRLNTGKFLQENLRSTRYSATSTAPSFYQLPHHANPSSTL